MTTPQLLCSCLFFHMKSLDPVATIFLLLHFIYLFRKFIDRLSYLRITIQDQPLLECLAAASWILGYFFPRPSYLCLKEAAVCQLSSSFQIIFLSSHYSSFWEAACKGQYACSHSQNLILKIVFVWERRYGWYQSLGMKNVDHFKLEN